jgi:Peptidase family C25
MMKKVILPLLFLSIFVTNALFSQMFVGTDTLYGNEWIDYSKTYYKIKVANDGVYRIPAATLTDAGINLSSVSGNQFRLYHVGKEKPIFVSSGNAALGTSDFIEFYGQKNRDEVDQHLFGDPASQNLNPEYSLFNDTAAYFLTWQTVGQGLRYTTVTNDLAGAPDKEDYCLFTNKIVYNSGFIKRHEAELISYSWFNGEGFGSSPALNSTHVVTAPKLWSGGPSSTLRVRFASDLGTHHQFLSINGNVLKDTSFYNWRLFDDNYVIDNAIFSPNLEMKIEGIGDVNTDNHSVGLITLKYPREFDFSNATSAQFELEGSTASKRYFEIKAINGASDAVLLDISNNRRYLPVVDGSTLKFNTMGNNNTAQYVVTGTGISTVGFLQSIQFKDFSNINSNYIILTHTALMQGGRPDGSSSIAAYKTYRESVVGGSFKVELVDINELYEQFAYGVRFHPMCIRNFTHYVKKNWDNPEYLYIIGKGLNYNDFRTSSAQIADADSKFYVPMYGTPATDCFFLMNKDRVSPPIMAIGRLAVVKSTEISEYLDKVIERDEAMLNAPQTLEARRWMKTALTTGGGTSLGERIAIRNNLTEMSNTIRNGKIGAEVINLYKTSSDPVQNSSYTQLHNVLKDGVFHWTFFGHSAPTILDFDTGNPNEFDNAPKYPIFMALGCDGGVCSQTVRGLGEEFVFTPHSGVIGFIATVNYGYIDALGPYARVYHTLMGGTKYGEGIGKIMQGTIDSLYSTTSQSLQAVLHQMILQGDPAIKLQISNTPDFVIDQQSVKISPDPVAIGSSPYTLEFDVLNLGKNTRDSLAVKIQQKYPNNNLIVQKIDTLLSPSFRTKYSFSLSANDKLMSGFNRLLIELDPSNEITETPSAAELNNQYKDSNGEQGVQVYYYLDGIQIVHPAKFAIVSKQDVGLKGYLPYIKDMLRNIKFEIDTLETFESPFVKRHTMLTDGGLIEWNPNITFEEEKVYYWRMAKDTLINNKLVWQSSSFVFVKDSPQGWNQSNFGQYKEDNLQYLEQNQIDRTIDFTSTGLYLLNRIAHMNVNQYPGISVGGTNEGIGSDWSINNITSYRNGVVLLLLNTQTGEVIRNPVGSPYNALTGVTTWAASDADFIYQSERSFFFETSIDSARYNLMNFLENDVPDGTAIAFLVVSSQYNPIGYAPLKWAEDSITTGRNLFQILENLGSTQIRKIQNPNLPIPPIYGGFFQKGNPDFEVEEIVVDTVGKLEVIRADFTSNWLRGNLLTTKIGPAQNWGKLIWNHADKDSPNEKANIQLLGMRQNASDTLLVTLDQASEISLDQIDPTQFKYLKLKYFTEDTLNHTATQIKKLRILFETVPEGSINPAAYFKIINDTVEQGKPVFASLAFQNISDTPMDSVLVRFIVPNNGTPITVLQKYKKLIVGDSLHTDIQIPTIALKGSQQVTIEVNPNKEQPELFDFNNFFAAPFYVRPDIRDPLLDVTFDGIHILDGDIISPKPAVIISLKDDNPYLLLSDTTSLNLSVIYPDASVHRLYFNDPTIQFSPAQIGDLPAKNQARLDWTPKFVLDGIYKLIVIGQDASGNQSGNLAYSINFEVITKSSISNVLNYPNPFSSSTCFIYTFTGLEQPSSFKIQIMTVSGRVVREIVGTEFGDFKAGRHVSNMCWDGKDDFGDQLANGVYLYKVIAKKADGSNFETFKIEQADGFFKNGLGKMVLIR